MTSDTVTPELKERAKNFDPKDSSFRTNALKLINEMNNRGCSRELFEELLHSIFFLGHIIYLESKFNTVILKGFTPEEILGEELFYKLKKQFQKPFDRYQTELPRRTPFSSVLEQVVFECGPQNEMLIVGELCDLITRLNLEGKYPLYSSTICVSQNESNTKCYGASMSSTGKTERQIMVAVSCLHTWHRSVSNAVMSYFPGKKKIKDFDGTMRLPGSVRCKVFSLPTGEIIPPCGSCRNLFGLETTVNKIWAYGNCAECESLSTLLTGEQIEVEVPPSCTPEMSERVKRETREWLVGRLKELKFNLLDGELHYYNPSEGEMNAYGEGCTVSSVSM